MILHARKYRYHRRPYPGAQNIAGGFRTHVTLLRAVDVLRRSWFRIGLDDGRSAPDVGAAPRGLVCRGSNGHIRCGLTPWGHLNAEDNFITTDRPQGEPQTDNLTASGEAEREAAS